MSKPYRSWKDYQALRVEAQRLVRGGMGINEAARQLDVWQGTMVRWATEDGFRIKDLEAERLTGRRAPLPDWVERAKYRRSGEMQYPEEYSARMAIAAEQKAEASREHVAMLSKPGGPLAAELDPEAAARRALVDADTLRGEGMFVTSERSARIAERLLRVGEKLGLKPEGAARREGALSFEKTAVAREAEARPKEAGLKVTYMLLELLRRSAADTAEGAEAREKLSYMVNWWRGEQGAEKLPGGGLAWRLAPVEGAGSRKEDGEALAQA